VLGKSNEEGIPVFAELQPGDPIPYPDMINCLMDLLLILMKSDMLDE
jgi:hypothetical protein